MPNWDGWIRVLHSSPCLHSLRVRTHSICGWPTPPCNGNRKGKLWPLWEKGGFPSSFDPRWWAVTLGLKREMEVFAQKKSHTHGRSVKCCLKNFACVPDIVALFKKLCLCAWYCRKTNFACYRCVVHTLIYVVWNTNGHSYTKNMPKNYPIF